MTVSSAGNHTPQSLRASSSILEEQLPCSRTGESSPSSGAVESMGNSPSKIEGAGGSMTASSKLVRYNKNDPQLKIIRRQLRNNSTKAEKALWNWLKKDQIQGLRFRRQYGIGNFILDFYCPQIKLCIELDGDYHFHVSQPYSDAERDDILLKKYGIYTLRFENKIVFTQPQTIINSILYYKQVLEHSSPSKIEGAGGSMTVSSASNHTPQSLRASSSILEEQLPCSGTGESSPSSGAVESMGNSPSKIEGVGGSMTASIAGNHTPQSLRASSSILEEQLPCSRTGESSPSSGAVESMGNSPSKIEGVEGSMTASSAGNHTPQSLRASSSILEEQLPCSGSECGLDEKLKKLRFLSCPAPVVSRQEHDIVTGINVGGAGTAMRFLTAFFAVQDGLMVVLDGDERMRQRPIAVLVDALRHLGAEIDYMGSEGYPPLRITGKHLTAGAITINPGVSSQYISALLMIAPLAGGMTLHLDGDPVSLPYIDMTLSLMRYHGIEARRNEHAIMVPAGHYTSKPPRIEGDWSAAAFWLALQALLPQSSITLQGLSCDSVQGDSAIQEIMEPLGVAVEKAKGIETQTFSQDDDELLCDDIEAMWQALVATGHTPSHPLCYRGGAEADVLMLSARAETGVLPEHYHRDMTATPDLVPILAVTLCLLRVPFTLVGLQTLRIKESDRVEALRQELSKLGYKVECDVNTMSYDGNHSTPAGDVTLDPHGDHRMVLALALAATRHPGITIKNAEVVTKSYPNFWKQLLLHPGT